MLMVPEFGFNKWGGGPQNLPQAWWFTRRTHRTQKSCWYSWFLFITVERHVLKPSKGKGRAQGAEPRRTHGPASRFLSQCSITSALRTYSGTQHVGSGARQRSSLEPWYPGARSQRPSHVALLWGRVSQGVRAHLPELAKDQSWRQAFPEDVRGLRSLGLLGEPLPAHQVSCWE